MGEVSGDERTSKPRDAEIVVIGGGIAGCSTAYHLAALGMKDVLLLERANLSCGTTWHSTGNMETYRDDPLIYSMVRYAVESLPRLEVESGQNIGWRNVGRVMYTDREERVDSFRTLPELGRVRGIHIDLLSAEEVGRRLPIIDPAGLLGGIWVPSDGRVNPTDVVMAYARAARARGVRVREHVPAGKIIVRDGIVRGVDTAEGIIACNTVVVAAGLWSGEIVRSCGLALPQYALEHQYVITKPIADLDRDLPLFLSYDDQLYGREEVGGLMIGSLDDHAVPIAASELPHYFANALLNERWEQFERYMATAMRRFPALASAGVKMLVNGPESFTPDGQMLLGPVPGADNLYCACAFNSNGVALSPAAGKFIAEWIVESSPSADVSRLDVRRFAGALSAETFMRERATEIPSYACRIHLPGDDYQTSRNLRLSPLHAQLAASGARFCSVNGWERPLWFEKDPALQTWLDTVAAEVAAAMSGALLIDRSSDTKIAVCGARALDWVTAHMSFPDSTPTSQARTGMYRGRLGQIDAMGRVLPWEGGCLLTAAPEQESRLKEWLRTAHCPDDVQAIDLTATLALLEIHGPAAPGAISSLRNDLGRMQITDDPIRESTLLISPAEGANRLWSRLLDAGARTVVRAGGHYAEEALRIAQGIPRLGRDVSPFLREKRTMAAFESPLGLPGFGSNEVVVAGPRVVGELTSRAWLPGWPAALSLGLMPVGWAATSALELVADGKRWPLTRRVTRWQTILSDG